MTALHITGGSEHLVIEGDPIASNDNHYVFTRGSEVVGRIKGTFDFSELPVEYHALGINMLLSDSRRVCLPLDRAPKPKKPTKKKWNWRRAIGLE